MKRYLNILLTGFEAFDGDTYNPSMEYILTRNHFFKSLNITAMVLPVSFQRSFEMIENQVKQNHFDLIIELGLAKNRPKISLEKVAINWDDARIVDADQVQLTGKIDSNLADGIFSRLDLNAIRSGSDQSKIEISYSAGTYVCNHLYFKTMAHFPQIDSVFIHLPGTKKLNDQNQWFDEELFLTMDKLIEKIIL